MELRRRPKIKDILKQCSSIGLLGLSLLFYGCGVNATSVPTQTPGEILANLVRTNLLIPGKGETFLENCLLILKSNVPLQRFPEGPKMNIIPPKRQLVALNPGIKHYGNIEYVFVVLKGYLYFATAKVAHLGSTAYPNEPDGCKPKPAIIIKKPECENCIWVRFADDNTTPAAMAYFDEE